MLPICELVSKTLRQYYYEVLDIKFWTLSLPLPVKVKVKFTLEQATKARRVSKVITLLFP